MTKRFSVKTDPYFSSYRYQIYDNERRYVVDAVNDKALAQRTVKKLNEAPTND